MSQDRESAGSRETRIVVQGTSGSGKTTLSAALAARLGVAYLELDGLYQQPDWTPLDTEEFRTRVTDYVEQSGWVIDGNYSHVRDILWPRATTIVIIDLPKRIVMTRLIARTLRRLMTRERLWNGNQEKWRNALSRDRNRNIILWAWNSHAKYHDDLPREARSAVGPDRVVVLTSPRAVKCFLEAVDPLR